MGFLTDSYATFLNGGETPGPFSRPRAAQVYGFRCADGLPLAIHMSSPPKFFEGLAAATGRADLLTDERFSSRAERVRHYDDLYAELTPVFLTRARDAWMSLLEQNDVPFAPINSLEQVLADPQVRHLDLVQEVEHPAKGHWRLLGFPVHYSENSLEPSRAAPVLGEHTNDILSELGYQPEEIQTLRAQEVI